MKSLSLFDFGDSLLLTEDLDPVYLAVARANLPYSRLSALLTAYWCFYSLGAAAWIAEAKTPQVFWRRMADAAANVASPPPKPGERWPRAAERRHFRGAQATRAVGELAERYRSGPSGFLDYVYYERRPTTFAGCASRVREHRGFGEWIAFKIADMGERVAGAHIDFAACRLGIYRDPRQGAALSRVLRLGVPVGGKPWEAALSDAEFADELEFLVKHWRAKKAKAPPMRDRLVGLQEVETILCKFKSYYKGHYHVGKDIHEVRAGLQGWGDLAQQLEKGLPPNGQDT